MTEAGRLLTVLALNLMIPRGVCLFSLLPRVEGRKPMAASGSSPSLSVTATQPRCPMESIRE